MNTKKIDSNRWEKIWILLSAAAGSSGVYFAFGSVFDPAADIRMFGIGMLMFVICWFPYVWMEKYVWAGCAVGILPVVWFWFVQREAIQEGLKEEIIGNSVLQIQQYFREIQSTVRVQADEKTMAAGMLALCSLFLAVCVLAGSVRKLRMVVILLYAAVFSFPFFTGMTIRAEGAALLGCAVLCLVMASPVSAKRPLVIAAAAALATGVLIPKQQMETFFADPAAWQDRIEDFFTRAAYGGVSDGKLGTFDEMVESGELQLEVTLSERPEQDVYFQGYIGTDYRDSRWVKSKETGGLSEEEISRARNAEYETVRENSGQLGYQSVTAEITRRGASRAYRYLPYKNSQTDDFYGDTYVEGRGRSYTVEAVLAGDIGELKNSPENVAYEQTEDREAYTDFVNEAYLQVPEEFREKWEDTARILRGRTLRSTVREVADYLGTVADYTKSPGRTPDGEDFVEYFLGESREGYCVHFASAGVLFLRMNGIPARFVSGYIARPSEFEETEDGMYLAELDDSTAHAWAEVYVEGCGWLPAEMTPAYRQNSAGGTSEPDGPVSVVGETDPQTEEPQTPEQDSTSQQEPQPDTQTDVQDGTGQSSENQNGDGTREEMLSGRIWIIPVSAALAALCLLLFARRRKWRSVRMQKDLRNKYLRLYRILYQMMEYDRKEPIPEDEEEICRILKETYHISNKRSRKIIIRLLETAFGNRNPEKRDLKELEKLCISVREKSMASKNLFQKFLFVFGKGF